MIFKILEISEVTQEKEAKTQYSYVYFIFQESDTLTGGNKFVTFDVAGWRVGLGICYDLRFPELSRIYALKGCDLLVGITIFKRYSNYYSACKNAKNTSFNKAKYINK